MGELVFECSTAKDELDAQL